MIVRFIVCLSVILIGCAAEPSQLQQIANEGLGISKRVNFSSSPEDKLQAAQQLLSHSDMYNQLISRSTALDYTAKAQRFQRQEREAAATLMREAAGDYAKQQNVRRARELYQAILTTFQGEEFQGVRRSAESSLRQLDEMETQRQ